MRYRGESPRGDFADRSPDPLRSRINNTPFDIIVSSPRTSQRNTPTASPTPGRHGGSSSPSNQDPPQPSPSPLPPRHTPTSLQQQPQPLLSDPTSGASFGLSTSEAGSPGESGGNQVSYSEVLSLPFFQVR